MWEPLKEEKERFSSRNSVRDEQMRADSLEGKRAAVTFPCGLKTGLFEGRAADHQELVGCVHELQLL